MLLQVVVQYTKEVFCEAIIKKSKKGVRYEEEEISLRDSRSFCLNDS